jgi:hypothetical protein
MIWAAAALLLGGAVLVWIGNRAMEDEGQSADVRIGGLVPLIMGGGAITFALILGFLALVT